MLTPANLANLRPRVSLLQGDLMARLADDSSLDLNFLNALAACTATLALLGMVIPDSTLPAERAVVADDGEEIRVAVYTADGSGMAAPISARRAIRLAADLLEAAMRHER